MECEELGICQADIMFSPIALNSLSYFFRAKYIFLNSKIDADYVMNKYIVLYGLKHKRGREFFKFIKLQLRTSRTVHKNSQSHRFFSLEINYTEFTLTRQKVVIDLLVRIFPIKKNLIYIYAYLPTE